ncbi:TetR family transcriptional regulator [Acinetobacter bereziniae]|uniref:TetR/AcrR family transcriptional regulator n=1 Tax=Acinetobacter bereziniae TaxID=106648 RepID=UPI0021D0FC77|nr:TetR/AcrR family transcriptional regulator [Acinetobacter bereziniae]MCU4436504.1 TetR family transcriptional regulator [Acinetobacter bereziniae]
MVRRTRAEMEETRAALIAMARIVFSEKGYAETSMDDLTAQAGFTRGALYHHFGDKKGLLAAVVKQIDSEMDHQLQFISDHAENTWLGFSQRCHRYLDMALEPEFQRIVLRDARAVLGGSSLESQKDCIDSMQKLIKKLLQENVIEPVAPQAIASLIYGSLTEAAFWIAEGGDNVQRLIHARVALDLLLRGLLIK